MRWPGGGRSADGCADSWSTRQSRGDLVGGGLVRHCRAATGRKYPAQLSISVTPEPPGRPPIGPLRPSSGRPVAGPPSDRCGRGRSARGVSALGTDLAPRGGQTSVTRSRRRQAETRLPETDSICKSGQLKLSMRIHDTALSPIPVRIKSTALRILSYFFTASRDRSAR
jgi:hypothetical protein